MSTSTDSAADPTCACAPLARFDALIFDMDGVVTHTTAVHAAAWKRMFDEHLERRRLRGEPGFEPFDIEVDYPRYVSGKPRLDGARDFLAARGAKPPEGEPGDRSDAGTLHGLTNRKDELFQTALARGVDAFHDAVTLLQTCRDRGMRTAIVTSSRNCTPVLRAAGLSDAFDVQVDGVESARLSLPGKPAPEIFLEAARRLGAAPEKSAVFEDSIAGVQAGRAGGFGFVVGVDRTGRAADLRDAGADAVVASLDQLHLDEPVSAPRSDHPPRAMDNLDRIDQRLRDVRPVVFLDYDGTLTPIVDRPEQATLGESMRDALCALADRCDVAVISGRDLADVRRLVGLDNLIYAGSHGYDIVGSDGRQRQREEGVEALPALDQAEPMLREQLKDIPGARVERKRFAIAAHYRNAADRNIPRIEQAMNEAVEKHAGLRKRGGKKIFELLPDADWNKGRAVLWLLETLGPGGAESLPIYIGDDVTDEDAFVALRSRGVTALVSDSSSRTAADYRLRDSEEVELFLRRLAKQA